MLVPFSDTVDTIISQPITDRSMERIRYLIWDFDGTLGYREGSWTGALLETWEEKFGAGEMTRDHIRPHLQSGFPWHDANVLRKANGSADEWWERLFPVFERAYRGGCNAEEAVARELARNVRPVFLRADRWRLFDDTAESLERLSTRGWRHLLLSNHVPELQTIIRELKIDRFFERIFNSAETGVEKPHPQAFRNVLEYLPKGGEGIMIVFVPTLKRREGVKTDKKRRSVGNDSQINGSEN